MTLARQFILQDRNTKKRYRMNVTVSPIEMDKIKFDEMSSGTMRRGKSVEHNLNNLDSTNSSRPSTVSSKENQTPSRSNKTGGFYQSTKIPPEQNPQTPRGSRQSHSLIQRQRPATFHNMSNLQKSMREHTKLWCQRVIVQKGINGLKEEFGSLKKPIDPVSVKVFLEQPAGTRNRYRDVVCLDKTRVVLKNAENDYIHANFVSAPQNEKRFICTQGPTDSTCGDFWRMIVQEKSNVILMLCNIFEKNMKKCAEYFPRVGETLTFDNITVTCRVQKTLELPKECVGKITVKVSGLVIVMDENPTVKHYCDHYQWCDWPDRGVPPTDLTPVTLLNAVRPCKSPITIHCSAGIGRTGSIVMIEYVIELFLAGKPFEKSDEILSKIRDQRSLSIQTDQQYLYVHRVLLEYFYRLNMIDQEFLPSVKRFVDDYNKATQV